MSDLGASSTFHVAAGLAAAWLVMWCCAGSDAPRPLGGMEEFCDVEETGAQTRDAGVQDGDRPDDHWTAAGMSVDVAPMSFVFRNSRMFDSGRCSGVSVNIGDGDGDDGGWARSPVSLNQPNRPTVKISSVRPQSPKVHKVAEGEGLREKQNSAGDSPHGEGHRFNISPITKAGPSAGFSISGVGGVDDDPEGGGETPTGDTGTTAAAGAAPGELPMLVGSATANRNGMVVQASRVRQAREQNFEVNGTRGGYLVHSRGTQTLRTTAPTPPTSPPHPSVAVRAANRSKEVKFDRADGSSLSSLSLCSGAGTKRGGRAARSAIAASGGSNRVRTVRSSSTTDSRQRKYVGAGTRGVSKVLGTNMTTASLIASSIAGGAPPLPVGALSVGRRNSGLSRVGHFKPPAFPIKAMGASFAAWACVAGNVGAGTGINVVMSWLPTYFEEFIQVPLQDIGVFAQVRLVLLFCVMWVDPTSHATRLQCILRSMQTSSCTENDTQQRGVATDLLDSM